ncbi:hypothetical protein LSAT2_011114 [Lamellibrachia satsuma]|nr:hypothetical protein LSAT2_011114 [Lamellibrachia satsuma]
MAKDAGKWLDLLKRVSPSLNPNQRAMIYKSIAEPLPRTALAVTGYKTYSCPQYAGLHFGEHDRKQHDDDLVEFVDGKCLVMYYIVECNLCPAVLDVESSDSPPVSRRSRYDHSQPARQRPCEFGEFVSSGSGL